MGPLRFERKTSRLSAERSTWLSYGPETSATITPSNLNLIFMTNRQESIPLSKNKQYATHPLGPVAQG
jgi:hypothetical protein